MKYLHSLSGRRSAIKAVTSPIRSQNFGANLTKAALSDRRSRRTPMCPPRPIINPSLTPPGLSSILPQDGWMGQKQGVRTALKQSGRTAISFHDDGMRFVTRRCRRCRASRGVVEPAFRPGDFVSILLLYFMRIPKEERMMLDSFGEEYRAYYQRTGRILPRLGRRDE